MESTTINTSKLDIPELQNKFKQGQFVRLGKFINKDLFSKLQEETFKAIQSHQRKIQIDLSSTTRNLYVVGGHDVANQNYPQINKFAKNEELLKFLKQITGIQNLIPGSHEPLTPAHVNIENRIGHHHGFHLDDAGFKFVIYIKWRKHPQEKGGKIGAVHHFCTQQHLHKPALERLASPKSYEFKQGQEYKEVLGHKVPLSAIRQQDFQQGQCYFMEGRSVLHEVTGITNQSDRVTLCYSFDDVHDLSNYLDTAGKLYPKN